MPKLTLPEVIDTIVEIMRTHNAEGAKRLGLSVEDYIENVKVNHAELVWVKGDAKKEHQLTQALGREVKGQITKPEDWYKTGKAVITLYSKADFSTFAHDIDRPITGNRRHPRDR